MTDQEIIEYLKKKAQNHYKELMWYIHAIAALRKTNTPTSILADDSNIEEFIYIKESSKIKEKAND